MLVGGLAKLHPLEPFVPVVTLCRDANSPQDPKLRVDSRKIRNQCRSFEVSSAMRTGGALSWSAGRGEQLNSASRQSSKVSI